MTEPVGAIRSWLCASCMAMASLQAAVQENPAPTGKERLDVPDAAAVSAAELKVREVFAAEYAARGAAPRRELARKLLEAARRTRDDAVTLYVLLREARAMAIEAGDIEIAWSAVEELAGRFALEDLVMRAETLVALGKKLQGEAGFEAFLVRALPMLDSAIVQLDLETAKSLVQPAKSAARRAQNPWLSYNLQAAEKRLEALKSWRQELARQGKQQLRIGRSTDETSAIGEFLCFELGAWKAGLPLLAQGNNPEFRKIAREELSQPQAAVLQTALADLWWAVGEGNPRQEVRERSRERARFWYACAMPELSGVFKAAAEKRVAASSWNYLSELEERDVQVAYGDFWRAGVKTTKPGIERVFVNGIESVHGLYMHALAQGHARVSYELQGRFRKMEAFVALKDTAIKPVSAFTFVVEGDGNVLWKSAPITGRGKSQHCLASVAGVRTLRLMVHCSGADTHAHAAWLEPVVR